MAEMKEIHKVKQVEMSGLGNSECGAQGDGNSRLTPGLCWASHSGKSSACGVTRSASWAVAWR